MAGSGEKHGRNLTLTMSSTPAPAASPPAAVVPADPSTLFPRRIPSLDGLRAVAIINVLVGHACHSDSFVTVMSPPRLKWIGNLLAWSTDSGFGVRLFFTLSGFLITWLLLSEENRTGHISLKMFYCRRALRILPVYWVFILSVAILHMLRPTIVATPRGFAEALTFTTGWFRDDNSYVLGHTWSLAVEELFYLLWPLSLCILSAKGRWRVGWGVVAIVPLIRIWLDAHGQVRLFTFSALGSGDAIMWGCLAAMMLWRSPERVTRFALWHSTAGRVVAFAVIVFCNAAWAWKFHQHALQSLQQQFRPIMVPFRVTLHCVASAYLTVSLTLCRRGMLFRLMNLRLMMAIGVLSYLPLSLAGNISELSIRLRTSVVAAIPTERRDYRGDGDGLLRYRRTTRAAVEKPFQNQIAPRKSSFSRTSTSSVESRALPAVFRPMSRKRRAGPAS